MELEIQIAQNSKAIAEAQKIRKKVFVYEQGIPAELDLDGLDNEAFHALATCNNEVIGTARLVLEENQRAVLARVAVVPEYRSKGIATELIKAIETKGRELNIKTIITHPHEHLKSYYESKGYKIEKKGGRVGNHQLLKMSKDLDKMAFPSLKTNRLLLRGFKPEDAPRVQLLASEREIADTTLNLPHPYEAGMAEEWIESCASVYESGNEVPFAITLAAVDILIGAISLKEINETHCHAEIGYWIGKDYWNKGYGTEAALAVVNYGFRELNLQRIYAHHLSRNPASGKVLKKIGMTHEGKLRQHILKWHEYEDIDIYGILKSEHSRNTD